MISEKKKFGRRKPAKIFLGAQIFKKKNSKKNHRQSKIQTKSSEGVKKPFSRGWGRFELKGGHKKSKQVGVYTPLAHLCLVLLAVYTL